MLKRTTEDVEIYFKENGCELIDEYRGVQIKMKYICSCGEIGFTSWNNFSRGKRCGKCAKFGLTKKRSIDEVKKIFSERGCTFLDDEFKGVHYSHNYICKCGNKTKISLIGFHHQKQYCRQCGIKKVTGSNNPAWVKDRGQKRSNDLFKKKCYKALSSSLKATGKEKVGRTSAMLGFTPKQLQDHIKNHPNWNNVKDGNWHLDHIYPIKAFIDNGITDISLINSLDNLQPMTQHENNSKWCGYNNENFQKWIKQKCMNN